MDIYYEFYRNKHYPDHPIFEKFVWKMREVYVKTC